MAAQGKHAAGISRGAGYIRSRFQCEWEDKKEMQSVHPLKENADMMPSKTGKLST